MTGHALLPGCQRPWKHDCPGMDPDEVEQPPSGELVYGHSVVCHCPCHSFESTFLDLKAQIRDLHAAVGQWHTLTDENDRKSSLLESTYSELANRYRELEFRTAATNLFLTDDGKRGVDRIVELEVEIARLRAAVPPATDRYETVVSTGDGNATPVVIHMPTAEPVEIRRLAEDDPSV